MVTDEIILPAQAFGLNRKTLVLDLDETLVHSSFTPIDHCDLLLPVSNSECRLKLTAQLAMCLC